MVSADATSGVSGIPGPPAKTSGIISLWPAVTVALALRLIAFFAAGELEPQPGIERSFFRTTATLASGYGYLMHTAEALAIGNGFDPPKEATQYMKEREAAGGRIDPQHPFPRTTEGWLPATGHPPGYATLAYASYLLGNFTGMLWLLHLLQIVADSVACVFVFVFARNVFDERIGRIAAWLYALCPPAIFLPLGLLPDSFHGFFISLVLAVASQTRWGRLRVALLAGAALGVACYFRTEYILLPAALFFVFWATSGRLLRAAGHAAVMVAAMVVILLPMGFWTQSAIGEFRLTCAVAGSNHYMAIGEDPHNPWGIVYRDEWLGEDALRRGFRSPWEPAASKFYGVKAREYVRTYPGRYARTVLFQRFPLALATPYGTGHRESVEQFSFSRYRIEEGLSRWQVIRKYPFRVLRHMWPQMAMVAYSGGLTLCLLSVCLLRWRDWRRLSWLVLPWGYTVSSIILLKGVEPRNVAPTLVPAVIAAALVLALFLDQIRRGMSDPERR